MRFYGLVLGILAVWRITHLLHAESGPWNTVERLRKSLANGFWSSLFDCFYCLSLWVAAPFVFLLALEWKERLLLWPALSAGAILLERVSVRSEPPAAAYFEEEEKHDVRMQPQHED